MPIFWAGPFLLVWDLLVMSKMMWVKFSTFVIIWKVKMAGKLFWIIHPSFGQVCLLLFETFRLLVMSKSCGSSSPYLILCFNKYGENGWKVLLGILPVWVGPFLYVQHLTVMSLKLWVKFSSFPLMKAIKITEKYFWVVCPFFGQAYFPLFGTLPSCPKKHWVKFLFFYWWKR